MPDEASIPLLRRAGVYNGATLRGRARPRSSRADRARHAAICITLSAALSAVALVTTAMILTFDAGHWGARRYARAQRLASASAANCDAGVGGYYLWGRPLVSYAMCVRHDAKTVLPGGGEELRFLVIGDWGRDGMCCQRDVAVEMDRVVRDWDAKFVVSTGDNFIKGIESADDGQVDTSWRDVYHVFENLAPLTWFGVVGNRDYEGDVMAQIELGKRDKRWHMPGLSYYETMDDVFFAFVDTTPMYYSPKEMGQFRMNGTDARVDEAIQELDRKLGESGAKWKFVVGHHPLYSSGQDEKDLQRMQTLLEAVFRRHKVAAYFSGHEHALQHFVSDDVHYFVSGGGAKLGRIGKYMPENRFAIARQGFMAVAVREKEMAVFAIDMAGVVMYTAVVPRPS